MQMISPTRLASFNDMQDSNFFTQFLNICCEKPVQPSYTEYVSLQHALYEGDIEMDKVIYAELSGDFPLGDSRQPTYKSLRP
ncbi:hypothetical protein VXQ31_18425, partial [Acinetobacter baumannii]